MLVRLLEGGRLGGPRGFDGGLDDGVRLVSELLQALLRLEPRAEDVRGGDTQRITVVPPRRLVLGLVGLGVALVVPVPAVGLSLDQNGPVAIAAAPDGARCGREDGLDVVAVDELGGDAV